MAAKKKSVKKKVTKKKVAKVSKKKAPVKKKVVKKNVPAPKKVRASKRKIGLVLKNLILFIVLALISFVLYSASGSEIYQDFFYFLAIILGFIALAFLIVLLVLVFMKAMKK